MFTFVGTELIVYALRDIEFDDIRDIYISYIDELEPFEGRQKQLRAGYYFDCACQRCCRVSCGEDWENKNNVNLLFLKSLCTSMA